MQLTPSCTFACVEQLAAEPYGLSDGSQASTYPLSLFRAVRPWWGKQRTHRFDSPLISTATFPELTAL